MYLHVHRLSCPRTLRIFCRKHLHTVSVYIGENIKRTIIVPDTWCPNTLSINFLSVFKPECRTHIQLIKSITDDFPVYQIFGMKDWQTGHTVHGRACEIKIIPDPDQIRVGKFIVKQWGSISSGSVICCPLLLLGKQGTD